MTYNSVDQYLRALKTALSGAPTGLVADALADCEEHLRGALAAHPGQSEAAVFADMARSYGSPEEVAAEYRAMDLPPSSPFSNTPADVPVTLEPATAPRRWTLFNVFSDPHTYGAMLYMLLALATGVFYFTWAVVGCSLSAGLAVLIVGIPFFLLFISSVRLLSLIEGRVIEALLGVRMPRRLPAQSHAQGIWNRIKAGLGDARTWSSLFYMFLMLPLGIAYFVIIVTGLSVSVGMTFGGLWNVIDRGAHIHFDGGPDWLIDFVHAPVAGVLVAALGLVALFLTLHVARALGWLHGRIAEHLLVRL